MKLIRYMLTALLALFVNEALATPNISVSFVLDESGSITSNNFQLETDGFMKALNALPADGSVELSIVGFASGVAIVKDRTILTAENFEAIRDALANNPKSGGGTNMSDAIDTTANVLSGSSAPTKVICLATDGEPSNESNTTTAADNAKANGITLTPVGIGLNSTGKTFLDSIASNPPVPNPTDFNEFATVVVNTCLGVVSSALNLELTPDPVDFGVFGLAGAVDICEYTETIGLLNHSDQPAKITNVSISGVDADQFELVSVAGVPAETLTFPFTLPPRYTTTIEVKLSPNQTPADGSYDAALTVTGEDENGVSAEFSTLLVAKYNPNVAGCLSVIDASPTIDKIDDDGKPLNKSGTPIGEINDVRSALQKSSLRRLGVVADGNARLFLTVKTNETSGKIRFMIIPPAQTEALLYKLDKAPTYGPMPLS
ncbi:hypothetical protein PN36_25810 [Candidatus Thiomargarita nelsonii]|uniref:VWFA domain-containing protein n=1 Tax=Candidatus Thiomargarita nelsonii TaxID=1003181 RepID=A0A0A6P6Q5_9GAMM|nr:hypothetical protein PN36_25810 [Candidatus Thiomargarita nelsonii]